MVSLPTILVEIPFKNKVIGPAPISRAVKWDHSEMLWVSVESEDLLVEDLRGLRGGQGVSVTRREKIKQMEREWA